MMPTTTIVEFQQYLVKDHVKIFDLFVLLMEKLEKLNENFGFWHAHPTRGQLEQNLQHSKKVKDTTLQYYPISVKDNICTKDLETTAGSRILDGYIPPFDATVVQRVKNCGGIIMGKTTMDEFGFGTFSLNSAHEIPRNAHDRARVAGGSSGGAAVLTALVSHHVALAVSTGGSISCPAAFNGVIGLTPTYGIVSRWGLIDYANSLDKIGLMGQRVEDLEVVFSKIKGPDGKNAMIKASRSMIRGGSKKTMKTLRIAVLDSVLSECDPRIVNQFHHSLDRLVAEDLIETDVVDIPSSRFSVAAYYIIATAEASTNLARYDGLRYGRQSRSHEEYFDEFFSQHRSKWFGKEAKMRILLGTFARMAGYKDKYYFKALKIRRALIQEFKEIFTKFDLVVTPTMPLFPPRIDEAHQLSPVEIYALDVLTIPPNLCGFPHLTLPMLYDPAPAGCQFIANHFDEDLLFEIGKHWQSLFSLEHPRQYLNMLELM